MHPAFDWTTPLRGIAPVLDVITATAITTAAVVVIMTHVILTEAVLTADTTGATPGGDLIPMTHHSHDHPDDTTANHNPTDGIDLTTEAGLNPWEDVIAADPVCQIVNVSGMLQSLRTGSNVEQIKASIPSHEPSTDQVAKIVCS